MTAAGQVIKTPLAKPTVDRSCRAARIDATHTRYRNTHRAQVFTIHGRAAVERRRRARGAHRKQLSAVALAGAAARFLNQVANLCVAVCQAAQMESIHKKWQPNQ